MPFKSQAQRAWMYANHPQMAAEWEAHTPDKKLPEHVGDRLAKKVAADDHKKEAGYRRRKR